MATIREVARQAGVSAATVSRILSGDPSFSVSEETKQRVFDVVQELGYVPYFKRRKAAPQKQTKLNIGCIFSSMYGNEQLDPNFILRMDMIEKLLAERDASLSFSLSELEMNKPARLSKLEENPPDGLIFMVNTFDELYQRLRKIVPFGIGIDSYYPDIDNVTYDKERIMEASVHYLVKEGYRRIAYIGGPGRIEASLDSSRRYAGYRKAMAECGLFRERYTRNCMWQMDLCYQQTQELFQLSPRPEAIILGSDNIAFSAYRAIYENGLRIPEDVAVLSETQLPISEYLSPKLSTVELPSQIVNTAVDLLLQRIQGLSIPPIEIIFHSRLVLRDSTPAAGSEKSENR